jgi:hypothetical protein
MVWKAVMVWSSEWNREFRMFYIMYGSNFKLGGSKSWWLDKMLDAGVDTRSACFQPTSSLLSDLWLIVDRYWNPKREIFLRIMFLELFWSLSLLGPQKLLLEILRRRKEWLPSCGCVPDKDKFIYKAARRKHVLPVTSGMSVRYKIYDFFRACVSVETTTLPSMEQSVCVYFAYIQNTCHSLYLDVHAARVVMKYEDITSQILHHFRVGDRKGWVSFISLQ